MRKLSPTLLISMGILASGSGMIQVSAADYVFFVDFDTKIVSDFNDYTPSFLGTTSGLENTIQWTVNTFYRMNACPPSAATDVGLEINYRLNGTGAYIGLTSVALPDMPCTVSDTFYQITGSTTLPTAALDALIADDANFIEFRAPLTMRASSAAPGRVITLTDTAFVMTMNYDFNTTYLFNYFLSDARYLGNLFSVGVVPSGVDKLDFDYVMTTAGNDRYFIINNTEIDYTARTKFAIDYEDEYFRGESIGSRYIMDIETITWNLAGTSLYTFGPQFQYFYLNAANKEQDIGIVPEFEYEYEDCGWNVFDIPCFINNGIAYVVNDAPVVSDAFTLLNAGMKLGGQAFSVIGQFTDNNLFGVLILGGLGITAVRWFLKND